MHKIGLATLLKFLHKYMYKNFKTFVYLFINLSVKELFILNHFSIILFTGLMFSPLQNTLTVSQTQQLNPMPTNVWAHFMNWKLDQLVLIWMIWWNASKMYCLLSVKQMLKSLLKKHYTELLNLLEEFNSIAKSRILVSLWLLYIHVCKFMVNISIMIETFPYICYALYKKQRH